MAVEAIQQVTQLEEQVKKQKEAAAVQNKQRLLDAQRAVRLQVEQSRQQAQAQAREMMAQAEAQAAQWTQGVLEQARQDCEEQKKEARSHLDQAAAFLAEKIEKKIVVFVTIHNCFLLSADVSHFKKGAREAVLPKSSVRSISW